MRPFLTTAAVVLTLTACGSVAGAPGGAKTESTPPPPVASDVATATSGGRTVRVELRLEPSVVQSGESPRATLTNTGKVDLAYGVPFKLERKTESGWRWVNRRQAFILPLLLLHPGEASDPQPIELYGDESAPVKLEPGLYRVTKDAGPQDSYPAGPTLVVRAEFRVV
ncbi:MAG TPA: immunoglobulin-like domain-containing protein [Gaiellaceae bacterium]|nr:immunoglobulin-like domain-containing protein [Gaiellaceae bacterium]